MTMRWPVFLALVAGIVASACGGSDGTIPSGSGTLRMMLKDSPFSDAKSLLVTFSEVDAHKSDATADTWTKLPFTGNATTRTCDLKKLQTAQDVLGTGPLTAGHYTQVRIVVSNAAIYFDNAATGDPCAPTIATPLGRSANVAIPSGEVKLTREFDVPSAGEATILLDFDGDKSVRDMGNGQFAMFPVIVAPAFNNSSGSPGSPATSTLVER
jgi:uncharacterized protein DUF4382